MHRDRRYDSWLPYAMFEGKLFHTLIFAAEQLFFSVHNLRWFFWRVAGGESGIKQMGGCSFNFLDCTLYVMLKLRPPIDDSYNVSIVHSSQVISGISLVARFDSLFFCSQANFIVRFFSINLLPYQCPL